jgi:dienelactone hydrolase
VNHPSSHRRRPAFLARFASVLVFSASAVAAIPRALPVGTLPDDARLKPLKDLDGYFPFTPPTSADAWQKRAAVVRTQIQVAEGLWPNPTKTPLNPVIHGRIDRGEYTVEKVYFESMPGFYVTGNLYRPARATGKVPAVLFAHGHWENARLSESSDKELRQELASGQERFEQGGRSRFQSMCVQLARMGCVVWQWDMLGDSDSKQFTREFIHGFAKQRPEMNTVENWGLFSPQAETHLQSVMGLQTWNSIRSVDFVLTLPEVDPARIAVTGASGGGTQTMLLAALDPRISLSFPAVMVSTAMQGGCTCENASLLRVDTGNVEFAGLFAPKPLGMTCANDWTVEMSKKGFPELQALYKLLGAPDNVMLSRGEQFPHNYNAVSRSAFYTWLNRHFALGQPSPVIERDYEPLPKEQLTVWDSTHPAPKSGDPDFERGLLKWWNDDTIRQLNGVEMGSAAWRGAVAPAAAVVVGRSLDEVGQVAWAPVSVLTQGSCEVRVGRIQNIAHQEDLPAILCVPKVQKGGAVLWLSDAGKAGLFASDGSLLPEVRSILDAGLAVLGVDLLYQGESLADGKPLEVTPKVAEKREAAAYTFGYNRAVAAERAHDVLSAAAFLRSGVVSAGPLRLVALGRTGPVAALARSQAGDAFAKAALHAPVGFFGRVLDHRSPDFLPGGAKYGDVDGFLALGSGDVVRLEAGSGAAAVAAAFVAK